MQSYERDHRMNECKSEVTQYNESCLCSYCSANDQAQLMNQMPNTNGMWIRRGAVRAIDLSEEINRAQKKEGDVL